MFCLRKSLSNCVNKLMTSLHGVVVTQHQLGGSAAPSLLRPVTPLLSIVNGFKMKFSVRRRCRDCFMVVRDGRLYNLCHTHPRHKVMSMKTHEKKLRILTYTCQSKIRPW